jgi:hypothetical protein
MKTPELWAWFGSMLTRGTTTQAAKVVMASRRLVKVSCFTVRPSHVPVTYRDYTPPPPLAVLNAQFRSS